jgi:DNA polymerase (family 10)
MPFGVAVARRGWLERKDLLNTLSPDDLHERLKAQRKAKKGKQN